MSNGNRFSSVENFSGFLRCHASPSVRQLLPFATEHTTLPQMVTSPYFTTSYTGPSFSLAPRRYLVDSFLMTPLRNLGMRINRTWSAIFLALLTAGAIFNFSWVRHSRTATELKLKMRSEEHTSELQSHLNLVCRL